jgi:hypothetical protein
MSNQLNQNTKNEKQPQDYKKDLEFWNFSEEGLKFWEKTAFETSFPSGKVANTDEMRRIHDTLKNRMQIFNNSSCYNYLDCYYNYYLKTYNSRTDEEIDKNSDYSFQCLKLFTYCWELEQ